MNRLQTSMTDFIAITARILGLVILLIGLFIGIKVIFEAWYLYKEPQKITRFTQAIEQGSHLNALLNSLSTTSQVVPQAEDGPVAMPNVRPAKTLNLTYFLAWFIVIMLLLIISSIAMRAIRTGGELALYDQQLKTFAQQFLKESKNNESVDSL